MKLIDTKDFFLLVMIAAVGLGLGIMFGSADAESGASQKPVTAPSVQIARYFPAQYTLNAPTQVDEHIQAF